MKEDTYLIIFFIDNESFEISTTIDPDYYPEFVHDIGSAFLEGDRFYHGDIGINFANVKYFYIQEVE